MFSAQIMQIISLYPMIMPYWVPGDMRSRHAAIQDNMGILIAQILKYWTSTSMIRVMNLKAT